MTFPLSQAVCCAHDIELFVHAFESVITKPMNEDTWYSMSRTEFSGSLRDHLEKRMMFGTQLTHVAALKTTHHTTPKVVVQITYRAFNGPIRELMITLPTSLWWDRE